VTIEGVELRLVERVPAGTSGRGWPGNRCGFELALASGAGRPVRLGADQAPPFNAVTSLVRSGGAVWLELSFNGYTREFPKGGNRVVAVDLCEGRVAWTSRDSVSNGGLLLLGDHLVTAYGFTSERRYLYVLDARSGKLVQRLAVVENICPSKSWAPNYDGGRCDAPGQRVGAAKNPRVEDGLLLVDTNTGSAAFQFE
jgi:outer membrane protein assembly factor BamB